MRAPMMCRSPRWMSVALPVLAGCAAPAVLIDDPPEPGAGWADEVPVGSDPDDPDVVDPTPWIGATFRITSPTAGERVDLGVPVTFGAALLGADGQPVSAERIAWSSDAQPGWGGLGLAFDDDELLPGEHQITATAELPTGDVLAHTVGVRVQHATAGTYAGLFSATGDLGDVAFTCAGSALIAVDALGEVGDGTASCIAGLGVGELPLDFVFDLDVDPATGEVTGEAGTVLIGGITYDFPATGTLDAGGLALTWGGQVPFVNLTVDATLDAIQVSQEPL